MPSWILKFISAKDLDDITQSVVNSEKLTSAEICPMVVKSSATTGHVAPMLFLLTTCLCLLGLEIYAVPVFHYDRWGLGYLAIIFLSLVVAKLLSLVPEIQKRFLFYDDIQTQVFRRAESEFYLHKLHLTKERVGVLLFVSLLERKVIVLTDEAVAKKLPKDTWNTTIELVIENIKKRGLATGIKIGIEHLSDVLKENFPLKNGDRNELSDRLIIKE